MYAVFVPLSQNSNEFCNMPQNCKKFHRNGHIPWLGSKYHTARKTVVPNDECS